MMKRDCFFSPLSLGHIEQDNFMAKAKYCKSSGSGAMDFASQGNLAGIVPLENYDAVDGIICIFSGENSSRFSEYIKSYEIVNALRKYKTPEFISYENFRRLSS